jgi:hypothetical protein
VDVTHINNELKNKIKQSNILLNFGLHVSIKLENYKEFVKEKPKIQEINSINVVQSFKWRTVIMNHIPNTQLKSSIYAMFLVMSTAFHPTSKDLA